MQCGMTTESASAYGLKTTGVGGTRAVEPQHGARERRVRNQRWRILGTNWARNSSDQLRPRARFDAFEVAPDKQLWWLAPR
jgi:hypothetical protein